MATRKEQKPAEKIESKESRFTLLMPPWIINKMRVCIVGCGAIGGYTGEILAKMGFRYFELWDDDKVELPNIGVQIYNKKELGAYKAIALAKRIGAIPGVQELRVHTKRFTKGATFTTDQPDVVIAGPDNIEARANVWESLRVSRGDPNRLYVDARVGPHMVELLASGFGGEKMRLTKKYYKSTLHKDIPPAPCGEQGTPYVGPITAGLIAHIVRNWATKRVVYAHTIFDISKMRVVHRSGKYGDDSRD